MQKGNEQGPALGVDVGVTTGAELSLGLGTVDGDVAGAELCSVLVDTLEAAPFLDVRDTRRCKTGLRSWGAVNAVLDKLVGAQLGSAFGDKLGEALGEMVI